MAKEILEKIKENLKRFFIEGKFTAQPELGIGSYAIVKKVIVALYS